MRGVIGYGAYVPYHRLRRATIAAALGAGPAKGARAVASFDEDTTSMGVEAGRVALVAASAGVIERLFFATSAPAYLDKTNATAIHAALGLPPGCCAVDAVGSVRSAMGALLASCDASVTALAVCSDQRTGLPGGVDERSGGDAAAAFAFGDDSVAPVLAELLGHGSATVEILDRWRLPGAPASRTWEERFAEPVYAQAGSDAFARALKSADLAPGDVDHLVVAGVSARAAGAFARSSGVRPDVVVDDLSAEVGNPGAAQAGVLLADVLDRAAPGAVVAVVSLADGADVLVLRTTAALTSHRAPLSVRAQIASANAELSYATFLSWKGMLDREPPRRPDPAAPAAPPAYRREGWKFGLVATRCLVCRTRNVPPARVCLECGTADRMEPDPLAPVRGTVAAVTVDRLAYTPSPPLVSAVVDFDGGGRLRCELTDVDAAAVTAGQRVEMTFRRMLTANGVHNYFWKARPVRAAAPFPTA